MGHNPKQYIKDLQSHIKNPGKGYVKQFKLINRQDTKAKAKNDLILAIIFIFKNLDVVSDTHFDIKRKRR